MSGGRRLTQHHNLQVSLVRARVILGVDLVDASVAPLTVIEGELGEVVLILYHIVGTCLHLRNEENRMMKKKGSSSPWSLVIYTSSVLLICLFNNRHLDLINKKMRTRMQCFSSFNEANLIRPYSHLKNQNMKYNLIIPFPFQESADVS